MLFQVLLTVGGPQTGVAAIQPASLFDGLLKVAAVIPKVWNVVFPDKNKKLKDVDTLAFQKAFADSLATRIRPFGAEVTNLTVLRQAFDVGHKMRQRASRLYALSELGDASSYDNKARGDIAREFQIEWNVLKSYEDDARHLSATGADPGVRWDLSQILTEVDEDMRDLTATVGASNVIAALPRTRDGLLRLESSFGRLENLLSVRMQLYSEAIAEATKDLTKK